jgi:hypothetical protein
MVMLISMGCNNQTIQNHEGENINSEKYEIISQTYNDKGITINYPQVKGMSDSKKQEQINQIIESEALHILQGYSDKELDNLNMQFNYEITLQNTKILSIKYSGMRYLKGTAHPTSVFFTTNINMNKGNKLRLNEMVNIDNLFVEKVRKGKLITESPQISLEMLKLENDKLIEGFNAADLMGYPENKRGIYIYFTGNSLGISVEVGHSYGDHVEFEVKYKDIADNIKVENEVWKNII